MSEIDARKALKIIIDRLVKVNGYYIWTPMAENGQPPVWLLRTPNTLRNDEAWQANEEADIIHICRPGKLLEALETDNKEEITFCSGYVNEGKCLRCSREMPPIVEKKFSIMITLQKLDKKVS